MAQDRAAAANLDELLDQRAQLSRQVQGLAAQMEPDAVAVGRACPAGLTVKTAEGPVLLTSRHRSGRAQLVLADRGEMPTGWADHVDHTVETCDGPEGLLVRPDGYVAWTSDSDEPLDAALARWLGPAQ